MDDKLYFDEDFLIQSLAADYCLSDDFELKIDYSEIPSYRYYSSFLKALKSYNLELISKFLEFQTQFSIDKLDVKIVNGAFLDIALEDYVYYRVKQLQDGLGVISCHTQLPLHVLITSVLKNSFEIKYFEKLEIAIFLNKRPTATCNFLGIELPENSLIFGMKNKKHVKDIKLENKTINNLIKQSIISQ
jgi:hypothetical protein